MDWNLAVIVGIFAGLLLYICMTLHRINQNIVTIAHEADKDRTEMVLLLRGIKALLTEKADTPKFLYDEDKKSERRPRKW